MMRDSIPKEDLLSTLDGIEEAPEMYGDLDAIEGIYFTLLGLLVGVDRIDEVIRPAFRRMNKKLGYPTNLSLTRCVVDPKILVKKLREIREEVLS